MRQTVATIDLDNLRHNIARVKAIAGDAAILAVVKADAYGHGMLIIARQALAAGAAMLCVAIAEEGVALRDGGITAPILVMGGSYGPGAAAAVEYGLIQTVFLPETVYELEAAARKYGKTAAAHIKIDTGMNRLGVKTGAGLNDMLRAFDACPRVRLSGAFTHFADADCNTGFTEVQLERFTSLAQTITSIHPDVMLHAANSAATLYHPATRLMGVRPGIALYGAAPAADADGMGIKPIMRLTTRVSQIKHLEPGDTVSYGRAFTAHKAMTAATLPVGYADGYMRALSGRADVLIGGKRARVLGRVCMDQMIVDVTGIDAATGDEATLIGAQGGDRITAWDIAGWADTIAYEVLTSISPRVKRVYVGGCHGT